MFLRGFRPRARCTIYTPMLPMSRGESFLENRVFSNPDEVEWGSLDLQTRRDFVKHSDRGVFDPPSLEAIAYDDRARFVTGRVTDVGERQDGDGVRLEYESPEGLKSGEHDYVVNCTGFDLLAQLRDLFAPPVRKQVESRSGPLWDRPAGTEVRIGRALELEGMQPRLHIPGLGRAEPGAGLREPRRAGPGLQPGAPAAGSRKVVYAGIWRAAKVCNINPYRLSSYAVFQSNRGELT